MSAFIGSVRSPHHNSPSDGAEVWCSRDGVEVRVAASSRMAELAKNFDPIAARNFAALLVRGAEEAERMRARERTAAERSEAAFVDPLIPKSDSFGTPPPVDTVFFNPRGRRYRVTGVDGNRCTLWDEEAKQEERAFWPLMVPANGWNREGPQ